MQVSIMKKETNRLLFVKVKNLMRFKNHIRHSSLTILGK